MWQDIVHGLASNFAPSTLLIIVLGTIFGAVAGALPGISSVSAMALVLPISFSLEPAQGLVLLGAVYMSSEFGGAIPAILLGTPGGSGAACTMLDGYPMTRKGEAEDALYLQLFAGVIGGITGVVILLFFTPVLASLAQRLGPPELFWASVAGLVLVASLSGRNILGGLIAVCIGVLLSIPGQDPTTGQLRLTFGSPDLVGGLPEVPILLGMFAVAAVLEMLGHPDDSLAPLTRRPGVIRYVLSRMWQMKWLLSWTSVVGTVVGLTPGAGSSASAFAAYSEAKRLSKTPENFGKGAWEGVAAPEAANNAVVGGSLIPLLGLGIPASATAAIMYGALTTHGIVAGPQLFETHSTVAYTFMTGLLIAVVAMLILGLSTVRYSATICRVPVRYIVPSVLALTLLGALALRNNPFDVVVTVVSGAAAFVLHRLGVSWIPMALGVVLGGMMEQRFQQSVLVAPSRGGLFEYWMTRPATLVLMGIVVLLLVSGVRSVIRDRRLHVRETASVAAAGDPKGVLDTLRLDDDPTADAVPDDDQHRWITHRTGNLLLGGGVIAVAVAVVVLSSTWASRARQLPLVLAVALTVLAGIVLLLNIRNSATAERDKPPFAGVPWRRWLLVVGGLVAVALTQSVFGLMPALAVFIFFVVVLLTDRSKPLGRTVLSAALCSAVVVAAIYGFFVLLLHVAVPTGIFF